MSETTAAREGVTRKYNAPSRIRNLQLREKGRARIVEAALKLFSEKGFHSTSVEEIAETAGLAVGAMYKYVQSKHDVLFLTFVYISERLVAGIASNGVATGDPDRRLADGLRTYCEIIDQYSTAVRLSYRENASLEMGARQHLFAFYYELRDAMFNLIRPVAAKYGEEDEQILTTVADDLVIVPQMWAVQHRAYSEHLSLAELIEARTELALRQLGKPR